MWVDPGTGETGKLPPIAWSSDRIAPDVEDDDDSSTCFIATAAYGSAAASEVAALRGFRDGFLLSIAPGRMFARAYYRFSPAFAEAVRENGAAGFMIRLHLSPIANIAGRFLSMN